MCIRDSSSIVRDRIDRRSSTIHDRLVFIGRRPILAAGNSNGDDEMLQYSGTPTAPSLRLLIDHDDADREFAYTAGAERVLEHAGQFGWTVVSMKNDWTTVFAD